MVSPVEATRGVYAAFGRGDIASVLALLAPDVCWTEAAGGPYGGTSVGPTVRRWNSPLSGLVQTLTA
jgi:ketosteroid isomerase-like protein